jgi:hypothetical protein
MFRMGGGGGKQSCHGDSRGQMKDNEAQKRPIPDQQACSAFPISGTPEDIWGTALGR